MTADGIYYIVFLHGGALGGWLILLMLLSVAIREFLNKHGGRSGK
jgi:hypothetical protein